MNDEDRKELGREVNNLMTQSAQATDSLNASFAESSAIVALLAALLDEMRELRADLAKRDIDA